MDAATETGSLDIASPWARFWAKQIDLIIWNTVIGAILVVSFPSLASQLTGRGGDYVLLLLALPISLVVDALLITWTGSSMGRALAGIYVIHEDGNKLTASAALERNLGVYGRGLCLGLPIFSLFTLKASFDDVKENGTTHWDRETSSRVAGTAEGSHRVYVVGFIAVILALAVRLMDAAVAQ